MDEEKKALSKALVASSLGKPRKEALSSLAAANNGASPAASSSSAGSTAASTCPLCHNGKDKLPTEKLKLVFSLLTVASEILESSQVTGDSETYFAERVETLKCELSCYVREESLQEKKRTLHETGLTATAELKELLQEQKMLLRHEEELQKRLSSPLISLEERQLAERALERVQPRVESLALNVRSLQKTMSDQGLSFVFQDDEQGSSVFTRLPSIFTVDENDAGAHNNTNSTDLSTSSSSSSSSSNSTSLLAAAAAKASVNNNSSGSSNSSSSSSSTMATVNVVKKAFAQPTQEEEQQIRKDLGREDLIIDGYLWKPRGHPVENFEQLRELFRHKCDTVMRLSNTTDSSSSSSSSSSSTTTTSTTSAVSSSSSSDNSSKSGSPSLVDKLVWSIFRCVGRTDNAGDMLDTITKHYYSDPSTAPILKPKPLDATIVIFNRQYVEIRLRTGCEAIRESPDGDLMVESVVACEARTTLRPVLVRNGKNEHFDLIPRVEYFMTKKEVTEPTTIGNRSTSSGNGSGSGNEEPTSSPRWWSSEDRSASTSVLAGSGGPSSPGHVKRGSMTQGKMKLAAMFRDLATALK